jgi:type II secretory pathway pseudopilin PulG
MFNRRAVQKLGSRSRGFSFTEILFAVIVLGIGFIMIAAIFPVAIQQGKLTSEEGTATAVAREALNELQEIGNNSDATPNNTSSVLYPTAQITGGPLFPATGITGSAPPNFGIVFSMRDPQPAGYNLLNTPLVGPTTANPLITVAGAGSPSFFQYQLWNQLKTRLVVPTDQRYAFVGLYRRNGDPNDRRTWSPFAQCWFIPVTARARSVFDPGQPNNPGADIKDSATINLQARLVKVSIDIASPSQYSYTTQNPYVLYNWSGAIVPSGAGSGYNPSALYENCYIIIADDKATFPAAVAPYTASTNQGRMNGHIYHVGLRRPDLDATVGTSSVTAYDLSPNGNFSPEAGADGIFGTADDIYTIGMAMSGSGTTPASPFNGTSPVGSTAAPGPTPADAYVISLDDSSGSPTGISQDISAFTTFIKVN